MAKRSKRDGRSSDVTFSWITRDNGWAWEGWRVCVAGWLATQEAAISLKINALNWFVDKYLPRTPEPALVTSFFQASASNLLPDLHDALRETMSDVISAKNFNIISAMIDWCLDEYLTEVDDDGQSLYLCENPFKKVKVNAPVLAESPYNAMPYTFIRELRSIICPVEKGHFSDWKFAQTLSGQPTSDGRSSSAWSDWIEVQEGEVILGDPDSVYRTRRILRKGKSTKITELWSPVRAVALYLKLELPLRTYQVRMLDSGEADTFRYENGTWVENETLLKLGRNSNPYSRGVFRKIYDPYSSQSMTGLFISTNKTADVNRESRERGYEIPWQHENVLYWLQKLRNWQEKHNPITAPTHCTDLAQKHFGSVKTDKQKKAMGFMCFLFRDPTSKSLDDRHKPIIKTALEGHWYKLLAELEKRIAERGQTLDDGSRITFVEPPVKGVLNTNTYFPLHSLRVSLISSYIMEGGVPIPAMGKLIAGHSNILMTLRYNKIPISKMTSLMNEASARIEKGAHESLQIFLRDASLTEISEKTAFHDESSVRPALAMRNPVGWDYRHLGMCLVGGNNVYLDDTSLNNGCWNGGKAVPGTKPVRYERVHHGDGNCACCRFLVTDASYLPVWVAHFNIISYRASLAAKAAITAEHERDQLLDAQFYALKENLPFTKHAELQQAERRHAQQQMEVNDFAIDLQSCYKIISRLIEIEQAREDGDQSQKFVATGSKLDIAPPIAFIETNSELWQLSMILQDAEFYPEEADNVLKTPAVQKRSQHLNRLLMRNNYTPIFMNMSDEMQLVAGNAMMRAMAHAASPDDRLEGVRYVSGLIEAGEVIPQLAQGIQAMEHLSGQTAYRLKDLIVGGAGQGMLAHG